MQEIKGDRFRGEAKKRGSAAHRRMGMGWTVRRSEVTTKRGVFVCQGSRMNR